MKLKPNISILNALIRITCGLTILSCATAKLVKKPWRESYYFWSFVGAMKVAEGIVRFCPMTYIYQLAKENCTHRHHDAEENEEELVHNPS